MKKIKKYLKSISQSFALTSLKHLMDAKTAEKVFKEFKKNPQEYETLGDFVKLISTIEKFNN